MSYSVIASFPSYRRSQVCPSHRHSSVSISARSSALCLSPIQRGGAASLRLRVSSDSIDDLIHAAAAARRKQRGITAEPMAEGADYEAGNKKGSAGVKQMRGRLGPDAEEERCDGQTVAEGEPRRCPLLAGCCVALGLPPSGQGATMSPSADRCAIVCAYQPARGRLQPRRTNPKYKSLIFMVSISIWR